MNIVKKHIGSEMIELMSEESQIHNGKTVVLISVEKSPRPIFVEYKDNKGAEKTDFFIRSINTTQSLNSKQAKDYISLH